jgi:hypothetical protein
MTAILVITLLVLASGVALVARTAWRQRGQGGGPDAEGGEDDGGGGRWRREKPRAPKPPTGQEPPWWPQFEREFRAYAARRSALTAPPR